MKRAILVIVLLAAAALITIKLINRKQELQSQPKPKPATASSTQRIPILYLFRDPSDNDAGCRRIYAYADRAEIELAGNVEVRRPDAKEEKNLAEQLQVRVLPTILIVSPTGEVKERFEGEGEATCERIEQALARLKETAR